MKSTQAQRQELDSLIALARAQRAKTESIESIVGSVLMAILGSCVLAAIAAWLTR